MDKRLEPEEKHIVDESPEISVGQNPGWVSALASAFPALRIRNYQLYFTGQFISLVGTWVQAVAQGWLVLQMTGSAFMVGLVAAASTFPMLLFTLFGGVIVDRFSKRKVLLFTQAASMALAVILGALTVAGAINIPEIMALSFLLGAVNAIDAPARQAFVIEMVDREALASAIALNSAIFNGARVIGPSIAGFLIAGIGTGGAFLTNGASYVAVLMALLLINAKEAVHPKHGPASMAIREGIAYSFSHPVIRTLLVFTAVTSIFGWSFTTIMPVIARDVFGLGAAGLGHLYAATGLGALTATVLVSVSPGRVRPFWFILGGNALFAASLMMFTFTLNIYLALFLLFLAGMGLLLQFSMINTTIQRMVEDRVRGRVMSLYVLMFLGLSPFGSFEVGFLAERLGSNAAIRIGAAIVFLFGLAVWLKLGGIRKAQREYEAGRG
ncbi:MAG: MFS transporter [Deltaproteobacteria bacterium]|nr:MFS transporter [Deltaproteobacteria bacterium]